MKTPWLSLAFCCILLLTSCNKTDEFEDLDLLLQQEWNLTSVTKDGIEMSEACDLDNTLMFVNTTDFELDRGALLCHPDTELSGNTWKLIDDFTTLRLKFRLSSDNGFGDLIEYWEIQALTDSTLILEDAIAEDNNQIPEIRTYRN